MKVIGVRNDSEVLGWDASGCFTFSLSSLDFCCGFEMGSIIGVHLDMWNGTLGFSLNRKFLGVVRRGLKGKIWFPFISTTSCSVMKLIFSGSKRQSLFYSALKVLPKKDFKFLPVFLRQQFERELPSTDSTDRCGNGKISNGNGNERKKFSWFLYFYNVEQSARPSVEEMFPWFITNRFGSIHSVNYINTFECQNFFSELAEMERVEVEDVNFLEAVQSIKNLWRNDRDVQYFLRLHVDEVDVETFLKKFKSKIVCTQYTKI